MKKMKTNDPLEGMTLQKILETLVNHYGWQRMGDEINIRCFTHDPSISSSLKFLRRTPWARAKVEEFYLFYLYDIANPES